MTMPITGSPGQLDDVQLTEDTAETCDRCGPGTRAAWAVFVPAGEGYLTFCASHYRHYKNRKE